MEKKQRKQEVSFISFIIYPDLSYSVALETAGLPKLYERREKISTDLFDEIVCNPTHRLHSLLPQRKSCKYALRRKSDFTLPICKTERLKNSFILSHVYKMKIISLLLGRQVVNILYPPLLPSVFVNIP